MKQTYIRSLSYNEDQDCVAIATDSGVHVFNVHPLKELLHLDRDTVGSVALAVVLHRTNYIAMVAGGSHPKFARNTAMIWDDKAKEFIFELTVSGSPILNILINYTRFVIVQEERIHVFTVHPNFKFLQSQDTRRNPLGVAAMGGEAEHATLAVPFYKQGVVQMILVQNVSEQKSLSPATIVAHQGEIAILAVNRQGVLLATGSAKGTVVRIFDTRSRLQLAELRRGTDPSTLWCLRFSPCSSFLAVTSDKGTVHIFAVRENSKNEGWINRNNLFDDTKRSIAQFSLPKDTMAKCAFVSDRNSDTKNVVAICRDGSYHRFAFNKAGHIERVGFDFILHLGGEQDFWTKPF